MGGGIKKKNKITTIEKKKKKKKKKKQNVFGCKKLSDVPKKGKGGTVLGYIEISTGWTFLPERPWTPIYR